jgi:hypothetical protein
VFVKTFGFLLNIILVIGFANTLLAEPKKEVRMGAPDYGDAQSFGVARRVFGESASSVNYAEFQSRSQIDQVERIVKGKYLNGYEQKGMVELFEYVESQALFEARNKRVTNLTLEAQAQVKKVMTLALSKNPHIQDLFLAGAKDESALATRAAIFRDAIVNSEKGKGKNKFPLTAENQKTLLKFAKSRGNTEQTLKFVDLLSTKTKIVSNISKIASKVALFGLVAVATGTNAEGTNLSSEEKITDAKTQSNVGHTSSFQDFGTR